MKTQALPDRDQMIRAFLSRDAAYQGVFFIGVRSTGIFCRIGCPAKTPRVENLEFYATTSDAMRAGFRPCKRCDPVSVVGKPPLWMEKLLDAVDQEPENRWTDADIRSLNLDPDRVRRWFQKHHGMTFHAYTRSVRLGLALDDIRKGSAVLNAALDHGYDSLSGFNEAFRVTFGGSPKATETKTIVYTGRVQTPLGPMVACATDDAVCILEFADRPMLGTQIKRLRHHLGCAYVPSGNRIIEQAASELDAYFAGRLKVFTTPLLAPGTAFQKQVWDVLRKIPHGTTRSYADIAREIGRPEAVRAVARANGDNRIAIMIPCHRVIGSNGALTGYGGGLWRKKRLLEGENRDGNNPPLFIN